MEQSTLLQEHLELQLPRALDNNYKCYKSTMLQEHLELPHALDNNNNYKY
jgi:hypothetical protein